MILERIVLHNFGPYLGRHEIELAPKSAKKPVLLFGGMNGGGKTSLLTALQLVLYGRQAASWRDTESSYESFLRKSIHRRADPAEGAGIELTFRSSMHGTEQVLHLCRYWRISGTAMRESLDVIRDGELDTVLAENWAEWVEEFIPARVAPLFFFDGEKIEELADPAKSSQILQAAIHSLLGLDIVDQLKSDLEILERRKRKDVDASSVDAELAASEVALAKQVDRLAERIQARHQELASITNEVDRTQRLLAATAEKLTAEGGSLFEQRHQLEAERDKVQGEIESLEDELRELAIGALPLALLAESLHAMEQEAKSSTHHSIAATVAEVLQERDSSLLSQLQKWKPSKALVAGLEAFLAEDRKLRLGTGDRPSILLDPAGIARTHALVTHVLPTEQARATSLLKKLDRLELQVQTLERQLAGMPDEEKILPLLQERERLRTAASDLTRKHDGVAEALQSERLELEKERRQLDAVRLNLAEKMLDSEDTKRILAHSSKARETLARFRRLVLEGHVQRIEKLALECFSTLMRKQHLVRDLRIDPATFAVTLRDENGVEVTTQKLSAGERQLLAIALLWGLGRASGRPLPTVIDTPLGRLDSSHRRNLIERYFPFASHQVILLSTDEEIDEGYLETLRPFITRSYLLDFDDRKQQTTVRDGYFWEVAQ